MSSTTGEGDEQTRPTGPHGLESEVILARGRARMLGVPQPATVGRYRIVEKLGAGGMGVVYSARDDELDRNVAIKILRGDLSESGGGRQRLIREAQAMAKLSHPNVVHVYEVGHHGDQVFVAMEYIAGVTLRRWSEDTPRTWREILTMHLRAGVGLAAAHEAGLVHRDYKMDNVLVGNDDRPRVLDFGLARPEAEAATLTDLVAVEASRRIESSEQSGPSLTMTGIAMGTPAYMAPEQLLAERIDARVDQFAFCVSLFEALYGKRPFPGATMTQLIESTRTDAPIAMDPRRHGVPRAVHDAILRGIRRDRTERFESMAKLLDALRKPLESTTDRRRGRTIAATVGVGALGLAIAAGAAYGLNADEAVATAPGIDSATPTDDAASERAAILAASDLPPLVPTPLPGDATGVTVHRLDNGLTVYIATQVGEPHIETKIVVRADHSDESPGHAGVASLATAMLAMGSHRLGTLDLEAERPYLDKQRELLDQLATTQDPAARDRLVRDIDAAYRASAHLVVPSEAMAVGSALGFPRMNAEVHFSSVLSATVPRNRFATWAELWAEPLRDPVLRGFTSVVAEQLDAMQEMAEYDVSFTAARKHLAVADGISSDWIGAYEHARTLPHDDVLAFLDRYYRPNNTAVVLVGDITAVEALPVLEKAFGGWEPAALPEKVYVDRPLEGPAVEEVTHSGPPSAVLAFPLPPANTPDFAHYEAFVNALAGQDGLLANMIVASGAASWTECYIEDRTLFLVSIIRPEQDPEQGEQVLRKALDDIAADRIPDAMWDAALARQELEATHWAISPEVLAYTIGSSFAQRRDWADVAESLGRRATREELTATARALLDRGAVTVRVQNGPSEAFVGEPLPATSPPKPAPGRHSAFAEALLQQPAADLEPQFLAPGRDYQTLQYGSGRVVVAPDDSPLFRLVWSWPIGVDREPLACDAMRAKIDSRHDWPGLRGLEIETMCASNYTSIEIVGIDEHFASLWPAVRAFIESDELSVENAEAHISEILARRDQARQDPFAKLDALHAYALRGEHAMDAKLPSDAAMRSLDPRKLGEALARVQAVDPDVAYVGPHQQVLLDNLPEPPGAFASRDPIRHRRLPATTIFVLDAPDRPDVLMRVSAPVPDMPHAAVLAELFEHFAHGEPERMADVAGLTVHPVSGRGLSSGRIAHHVQVKAGIDDTMLGIETVLTRLQRPRTAEAFARAHQRAEASYRAARAAPRHIPLELQRFIDRGLDRDPKFANWLALASIDLAEFDGYADAVATAPLAIAIVGDVQKLDRAALGRIGKVVEVDAKDLLRDPGILDIFAIGAEEACDCFEE